MILRDEGETNLVTRIRINVGRVVGKSTVLADCDVDDLAGCSESIIPEGFERISRIWWVDREHHAFTAVTRLSAVEPEWFLRPDFGQYYPRLRILGVYWLETRIKANGLAVLIGQLGARVVK